MTHISVLFYLYLSGMAFITSCRSGNQVDQAEDRPTILVFSKTTGYYHKSIPAAQKTFLQLGKQYDLEINATTNAAYFSPDSLSRYHSVVFLSTTGDVLTPVQQEAFEAYIRAGGGFMGVHAATDTEYAWPWYNRLVGAYFDSHPEVQQASILVTDKKHPATRSLPESWQRTDEWYNFKNMQPGIAVLAYLDETSYEGGTNGKEHPIIWYHPFDGGRAFYTAGGHTEESYSEPLFLEHLLGGLRYTTGHSGFDNKQE